MHAQRDKGCTHDLKDRLQNGECSLVDYIVADGQQTGLQGQYRSLAGKRAPTLAWSELHVKFEKHSLKLYVYLR